MGMISYTYWHLNFPSTLIYIMLMIHCDICVLFFIKFFMFLFGDNMTKHILSILGFKMLNITHI